MLVVYESERGSFADEATRPLQFAHQTDLASRWSYCEISLMCN